MAFLLQEDGDKILLEVTGRLLLELSLQSDRHIVDLPEFFLVKDEDNNRLVVDISRKLQVKDTADRRLFVDSDE